jgi:hypothetical protein
MKLSDERMQGRQGRSSTYLPVRVKNTSAGNETRSSLRDRFTMDDHGSDAIDYDPF